MSQPNLDYQLKAKADQLRRKLSELGAELEAGDESELLVWAIPGKLACAHRPLRHHVRFHGSGLSLPPDAVTFVFEWVQRMKDYGIRGIISLMHKKELAHYRNLDLGAESLIELYRKQGFVTREIPWDDPAHRPAFQRRSFSQELKRIQVEALQAFDELPKPVLLHCSAGIDRSSPVAAFIYVNREGSHASVDSLSLSAK
jgi:hypothetical protein